MEEKVDFKSDKAGHQGVSLLAVVFFPFGPNDVDDLCRTELTAASVAFGNFNGSSSL